MYFDSPEWSLLKTTKLLSDESVHSNTDIFSYADQELDQMYDMPPKIKNGKHYLGIDLVITLKHV